MLFIAPLVSSGLYVGRRLGFVCVWEFGVSEGFWQDGGCCKAWVDMKRTVVVVCRLFGGGQNKLCLDPPEGSDNYVVC